MSSRALRFLIGLYPPEWRRRYGQELQDLVAEMSECGERTSVRPVLELIMGAAAEWLRRSRRQTAGAIVVLVALCATALALTIHAHPHKPTMTAEAGRPRKELRQKAPFAPSVSVAPCFISSDSTCSQTPCREFINNAELLVPAPTTARRECASYPSARARALFVKATG